MAIITAVKTGNWSDTTVWSSASLPTPADDVYANNFTITLDGNYSANLITNRSRTAPSAAGGGTFILGGGRTLTANLIYGSDGPTTTCVTANPSYGQIATVISAILGGSASGGNAIGVTLTGLGTLNAIGRVTGGSNALCAGIRLSSGGVINVTGDCYGGSYNNGDAVMNSSLGTVNIVGNCYGTQAAFGGNAEGSWPVGANNGSSGNMFITGNLYGSTLSGFGPAAINPGSGIMDVVGALYPSLFSAAIARCTNLTLVSGPLLANTNGIQAIYGLWRWKYSNTGTYMSIRTSNLGATRNLYTSNFTSEFSIPSPANVRSGVIYGPSNELTGTCQIPPAGSTILGVPVDDTTGTMLPLSSIAAEVWDVATANISTAGSIGVYLKNTATTQVVGDLFAGR